MTRPTLLFALVVLTFAEAWGADESIVQTLENAGVLVRAARVDVDGKTEVPTGILIPRDLTLTDQLDRSIRSFISTLDAAPTLYIREPRIIGNEKLAKLADDFQNLTVKRIDETFLGIRCRPGILACKVDGLVANSPAETSGLKSGDTIVRVNDYTITNFESLQKAMQGFLPNETITIHVKRDSMDLQMNVTLTALSLPSNTDGEPADAHESPK